jgi:enoyl-CoA hydratase/carnithine racemase
MAAYETILVAAAQSACVITLNRPERRNAISLRLMQDFTNALTEAAASSATRSVIVTGGLDCFSAGRDLKESAQSSPDEREQARLAWRRVTNTIEALTLPVVAAIEGHCLTGGLELALACDLRVAAAGASFGVTSARLGSIPGFGATQRLPRLIGVSRAFEILFSANPIDVDEAWRIGLINRKAAKGAALAEALAMVEIYQERAPLSLATIKQAVRQGMGLDLSAALDLELRLGATLAGTADRAEGMAAFAQKRKPRFQGR